tara:strand:+ start:1158 stop:1328 length:171 start_codon:yes stop_codon:yes gene_type:complete
MLARLVSRHEDLPLKLKKDKMHCCAELSYVALVAKYQNYHLRRLLKSAAVNSDSDH